MLNPAFDHLWLDFDTSQHYLAIDRTYNDTLYSHYLPYIPAIDIVHSPDISTETLNDVSEYRGTSSRRVGSNELADHGIVPDVRLPSHIAIVHSPELSTAPLPDAPSQGSRIHATSQPVSIPTSCSDGQTSLFNFQYEWHTACPQFYVAPPTNTSTPPVVYGSPFGQPKSSYSYDRRSDIYSPASPRSSTSPHDQQTSCDNWFYDIFDYRLRSLGEMNGAIPATLSDDFNLFGSKHDGTIKDPACMPMSDTMSICGGPSKSGSTKQAVQDQDRQHSAPSYHGPELTGLHERGSSYLYETQDERHSSFQRRCILPEQHFDRYNCTPPPSALHQTLGQRMALSSVSQPDQYFYSQPQDMQTWSFPDSGSPYHGHWQVTGQVDSYAPMPDWTSQYLLPESRYILPEICASVSGSMSDFECPLQYKSPTASESSSLVQRHTARSRLTAMDTKPYSRKNLISSGVTPVRKADIFAPSRPIQCTLRIERGDRKGQKCNIWCDGVDEFTKHLKEACHNFSPCKRPPSKSPGADYAPVDDELPMEWGFCTWDQDNDCETFKTRRRKNRLGPMSGGDLIRHIREAHAGVPR